MITQYILTEEEVKEWKTHKDRENHFLMRISHQFDTLQANREVISNLRDEIAKLTQKVAILVSTNKVLGKILNG